MLGGFFVQRGKKLFVRLKWAVRTSLLVVFLTLGDATVYGASLCRRVLGSFDGRALEKDSDRAFGGNELDMVSGSDASLTPHAAGNY